MQVVWSQTAVRRRKTKIAQFPVTLLTGHLLGSLDKFDSPNPLLFNTIFTSNSIVFLRSPPYDSPTKSDFKRNMDLSPINHLLDN